MAAQQKPKGPGPLAPGPTTTAFEDATAEGLGRTPRVAVLAMNLKVAENYCEHAKNRTVGAFDFVPVFPLTVIDGDFDVLVDVTGLWDWFHQFGDRLPPKADAPSFDEFVGKHS